MEQQITANNQFILNFTDYIHSFTEIDDSTVIVLLKFDTTQRTVDYGRFNITKSFLSNFLKTTRAGSAQKHTGMSIRTFFSSLVVSLVYCLIQAILFTFLRNRLKRLYQARLYQRREPNEAFEGSTNIKIKKGLFDWVVIAWKTPLAAYKVTNGLDAFFFLRFLKILSLFFLSLSVINVPILLPVHYSSGTPYEVGQKGLKNSTSTELHLSSSFLSSTSSPKVRGLDKLSMSNISPQHSKRLILHFMLAVFVVVWFHALLIEELEFYIKVKNDAVSDVSIPGADCQSLLFIDNIPKELTYLNNELSRMFHGLIDPGCAQITLVPPRHEELRRHYLAERYLIDKIESLQVKMALHELFRQSFRRRIFPLKGLAASHYNCDLANQDARPVETLTSDTPSAVEQIFLKVVTSLLKQHGHLLEGALVKARIEFRFKINMIYFYTREIASFGRHLKKKKYTIKIKWPLSNDWGFPKHFSSSFPQLSTDEVLKALSKRSSDLVEELIENRRVWDEIDSKISSKEAQPQQSNSEHLGQAFISFKEPQIAHLFGQVLLSNAAKEMNNVIVGPNPNDIIWSNLTSSSKAVKTMRRVFSNIIAVIITVGWVIPVAFVGLISQIPYMKALVPFFTLLDFENDFLNDAMSNLVPILTLLFLIDIVPFIFRWLSILKGKRTRAEVEIDVQKWLFVFFFVHIFLVVTISSGISVMFEKILNNPTTLPDLLAGNLPKSSNFFFSFILIRGLAYFGGNLIQLKELLSETCYHSLFTKTPRRVRRRMRQLTNNTWGSVYPLFSTLASIGIVYSVIAPLMLIFATAAFFLVQFSSKCRLNQQQYSCGYSDTFGRLYPQALLQLYAGIYCLEICLVGLFALSNCYRLVFLMALTFIFTILAHFHISTSYKSRIEFLPLIRDRNPPLNGSFRKKNLFPFSPQKRELWIPWDIFDTSEKQCSVIKQNYGIAYGSHGCVIDITGDLCITNACM